MARRHGDSARSDHVRQMRSDSVQDAETCGGGGWIDQGWCGVRGQGPCASANVVVAQVTRPKPTRAKWRGGHRPPNALHWRHVRAWIGAGTCAGLR